MSIFGKLFNRKDRKDKKFGLNSAPKYADSSSIPPEERKYYQPDEYYTFKTHEGTIFEFEVIPFETRKLTSSPSENGLYVPEILMLSFCKSFPNPKNGYPGYWWFNYGIRDVGKMLKSLEKRGFIEIDSIKGKYKTTQLGNAEIEANEYVAYTHRNSKLADFTAWDMNKLLAGKNKSNWLKIYCKKTGQLPPINKNNSRKLMSESTEKQAVKKRIPIMMIKNKNNWPAAYDNGYPHYQKGEQLRKAGYIYSAIEEYDEARSHGYNSPALYWSYAMAFRKIKDYENEIDILDEAFNRRIVEKNTESFVERRKKAVTLKNNIKNK